MQIAAMPAPTVSPAQSHPALGHPALGHSAQSLNFYGADIEIQAHMRDAALTIDILKSGTRVHRVTLSDATSRLEHGWLADLFAREHKVDLGVIAGEMNEYVENLDINQG